MMLCVVAFSPVATAVPVSDLEQFKTAWDAAGKGDHDTFRQIMPGLQDYILYPYLQYEDYRNRRAKVPAAEMLAFLELNRDLPFAAGLRITWLKSLAKRGRWVDLVANSSGVEDTVLRCQRARGKIILKQTMIAGNPRLTVYLARFIPKSQRRWLENWQRLSRNGYSTLEKARGWPDSDITRMITSVSI